MTESEIVINKLLMKLAHLEYENAVLSTKYESTLKEISELKEEKVVE